MEFSVDELLPRVAQAAQTTKGRPADSSYLTSYPALVAHVAALRPLDQAALAVVAHMAYGWMPTVLHLDFEALAGSVRLVEDARQGMLLDAGQIQQLASAVNRSVVGASKVLHFVNPAAYPIWDRRVFHFLSRGSAGTRPKGHYYQINDATTYVNYAAVCREVVEAPAFNDTYQEIRRQFGELPAYAGHEITRMRALEYIMFTASGLTENDQEK